MSTHIDDRVPIHQFCDRFNSFQGGLQLVAFTLNHRLLTENKVYLRQPHHFGDKFAEGFGDNVQSSSASVSWLTLTFSPVTVSSSASFPMVKVLTRTCAPVVMVTLKLSPFSSISEMLLMSLPFWIKSSGRPKEEGYSLLESGAFSLSSLSSVCLFF